MNAFCLFVIFRYKDLLMKLHVDDAQKYLVIDECSQTEYDQLCISYNKDVKNARFSPQFKSGTWDGKINFLKNITTVPLKYRK